MNLPTIPDASATPELLKFREHEKIVERNLAGFIEAGIALVAIKADREYRLDGYSSFEDYCRDRWQISRPRAYQLVVAASIAEELSTLVDTPAPQSERQVRPLTLLKSDDDKREAWAEAVDHAEGGQPTAAQVEQAVAKRQPPRPLTADERAAEDDHYRAEARRQFNFSTGNALVSLSILADAPDKLADFVAGYEGPPSLTTDEIKAVGRAVDQMINEWRYP